MSFLLDECAGRSYCRDMMNTTNTAGKHIDLSHQYGCRAWMTVAYFTVFGVQHVARRFFRADMAETGKIELYTVAPDRDPQWTFSEDWLGYAVEGTRVAAVAAHALASVDSMLDADQRERFAAVELT